MERKRAAQQEETRKLEQEQRREVERQRERTRAAVAEDPRRIAQRQAIEQRRLDLNARKAELQQRNAARLGTDLVSHSLMTTLPKLTVTGSSASARKGPASCGPCSRGTWEY